VKGKTQEGFSGEFDAIKKNLHPRRKPSLDDWREHRVKRRMHILKQHAN
jgi:hypothetical protein